MNVKMHMIEIIDKIYISSIFWTCKKYFSFVHMCQKMT